MMPESSKCEKFPPIEHGRQLQPMKNSGLQDIKPVYIHDNNYSTGNEVSPINLAMILAHRKVTITSIITAVIALGLTVTFG